uniref:Uncharacterized protein n=1 Tax=Panagrolaimus superbus TaxID=310955 RepID=A0A914Y7F9_9BILA
MVDVCLEAGDFDALDIDSNASPPILPQLFKDFKIDGYDKSVAQKDWTAAVFKRIFGQLLKVPYKGTCIYLCPFCMWKGPLKIFIHHLVRCHGSGKLQQKQSCCSCECPLPNNELEIQAHSNRCFKSCYKEQLLKLLLLFVDDFDVNDIFNQFKEHL